MARTGVKMAQNGVTIARLALKWHELARLTWHLASVAGAVSLPGCSLVTPTPQSRGLTETSEPGSAVPGLVLAGTAELGSETTLFETGSEGGPPLAIRGLEDSRAG